MTTRGVDTHPELTAAISALPEGPGTVALFDFDGTLMHGYSAVAFLREQLRRGDFSAKQFVEMAAVMTRFGIGDIGFSAMMATAMQFLRDTPEADFEAFGDVMYEKHIAKEIYPEARALVAAHLERGHTVAIVSSATRYQIEPAAQALGISRIECTGLEVVDGKFTGHVLSPTCFGPGKVSAAQRICDDVGATLADAIFYSDSDDDIELLEAVRHPRPVNANRRLTAISEQRGWTVERFAGRGRPGLTDWVRSIAATGSLATSFAASLPILALTRSRRHMQNFSIALFSETASALIGLDLAVRGEEHLWEQRPAVFVFNHQSKADLLVMLKLLRRDVAGVGKAEIRRMPVIGQVLELGGAVLIDRKNAKSAISAMQPLVDVMHEEGKSLIIAPEGTRSLSTELLPFKKGAFHIAMQAGVPIVPVVIHNSIDVAPKGTFVFRPATVHVDVLPPVDTSGWQRKEIDSHIEAVRQQFVDAMGQADDDSAAPGAAS
ncbi:MAG: HAD-IB family hydrolase [Pseudomonadota bacterium]